MNYWLMKKPVKVAGIKKRRYAISKKIELVK